MNRTFLVLFCQLTLLDDVPETDYFLNVNFGYFRFFSDCSVLHWLLETDDQRFDVRPNTISVNRKIESQSCKISFIYNAMSSYGNHEPKRSDYAWINSIKQSKNLLMTISTTTRMAIRTMRMTRRACVMEWPMAV